MMAYLVGYGHYRMWVLFPTLNIFRYNASKGGDEIYRVQNLSFYVNNILLNLNLVGSLGLVESMMMLLLIL